jgi:hypothetical protein
MLGVSKQAAQRGINGAHPHDEPRSTRQGGEPTPAASRRLTRRPR